MAYLQDVIGRNIAAMRKEKGLSQSNLAAQLNTKQTTVTYWETGRFAPSAYMLYRAAHVLGCTIDDLFRGYSCDE